MQTPLAATAHVLLLRGDEILLLRRLDRTGEEGPYDLVAGRLDGGETVTQAAMRSAFEEVGVTLAADRLRVAGVMHRLSEDEQLPAGEHIDFFVVASEWSDKPRNRQPERCSEMHWFALDALPRTLVPFVRAGIENHRRGVSYSEFGWGSGKGSGK
ncbi:MAG: NUDIX domain-containing protein [Deltaproteobacteria bacterium]|nr:NUDIX domain-containing protein [Deltaproteobacteria bacterium]MBW2418843.1 NUDIX domain-containing protein [Deltaproteobacteria bacterium]